MENVGLLQIACLLGFPGKYEFVGTTFSIMHEKAPAGFLYLVG